MAAQNRLFFSVINIAFYRHLRHPLLGFHPQFDGRDEQANAFPLGCISTIIAGDIYRAILPAFIRNSRRDSSSVFWGIEAASFVFISFSFF
jgi:hypothetical protein